MNTLVSLIKAVRWKVKEEGPKRSMQLFDCFDNELVGAESYWEGDFDCSDNLLTSLEGAPKEVGVKFYCSDNQLASLEGANNE